MSEIVALLMTDPFRAGLAISGRFAGAGVKDAGPTGTVRAALAYVSAPGRMRGPGEHAL